MTRLQFLICATTLMLSSSSLLAQSGTIAVTIRTEPAGAQFTVDGVVYRSGTVMTWQAGSSHVLNIPLDDPNQALLSGVRYMFTGWTWEGSGVPPEQKNVVVTAGSGVASYTATFRKEYAVGVEFEPHQRVPPGLTPHCETLAQAGVGSARGVVAFDGVCYWGMTTKWVAEGTPVTARATALPGYVFTGWKMPGSLPIMSEQVSVPVIRPTTLTATFEAGRRTSFTTEPLGLDVFIDRMIVNTPSRLPCEQLQPSPVPGVPAVQYCVGEMDLAIGRPHLFQAPSPQQDRSGKRWIFREWSGTGQQTLEHTPKPFVAPEAFTAKFVPAATVAFTTVPNGLKLNIEGRENWPSLNFIWGVGMTYKVSAPLEQTGPGGRRYAFRSWSNEGAAAQDVTVPAEAETRGYRLVATYERMNRVVVNSSVPGATLVVNGKECTAPCTVDGRAGEKVAIRAPETIPVSDLSKYEFWGFTQEGAPETSVTLDQDFQAVTARYVLRNKLTALSEPNGGVDFVVEPGSADGFYNAEQEISITAKARPGFKFIRWDGDLEGTYPTGHLSMSSPHYVRALLSKHPYIAPAGVRNAAGETPEPGVAAGSLISVYGQNLANRLEVGPTNPLAQTLADVVVLLDDRILQLVYVSPEQINAILPLDVAEGEHTLTVKNTGSPDVTATFTVVRNAPGLFNTPDGTKAMAIALHEDGSLITPASPAKRSEVVTLLGTGFGPWDKRPVEGFAVPAEPVINLVDNVELISGEVKFGAQWAGAAPGHIGVAGLRMRVPADLPSGLRDITVQINGHKSNSVVLSVE